MITNRPNLPMKRIVVGILLLITLMLAASTIYFFYQYQQIKKQYQNSTTTAQVQQIVAEVSKLMLLPKNETPTIATINDVTKLKGQPFFANAKNGDKVLIYPNASIAILYNPSAHLIISVSPISLGNNTPPSPLPTEATTPTPTIRPKLSVSPTPLSSGPTLTPTQASQ